MFDGDLTRWAENWGIISAIIDREPDLTDNEKNCHLLQSMGTPETKAVVEGAIAYTDKTYRQVVERVREAFERKRVTHALHLKALFPPTTQTFGNRRSELNLELDRLERHTRGLAQSDGYSAEQIVAAMFEGRMDPSILPQWKKYTASSKNVPTASALKLFLKE